MLLQICYDGSADTFVHVKWLEGIGLSKVKLYADDIETISDTKEGLLKGLASLES